MSGTDEMPPEVAVIGLGSMGGAMAGWLAREGWRVRGYDPAAAARDAAATAGVDCVSDIAALAGIRYIVLSLPSAAVVAEVVPVVVSQRTRAVIDTTTSDPETARAMAAWCAESGSAFVDAPVSGGRAGAESGRLTAFVGGDTESVAAALPVLRALTGGGYRHLGPAGAGTVVKLINNMLCATNLAAVAEAMDVAAVYGVDLAAAAEAVSGASGGSRVAERMFPDWILSGTFESGFATGLMSRDVSLALHTARSAGADPSVMAATDTVWRRALARLGPTADFTAATTTFTTATDALTPQE